MIKQERILGLSNWTHIICRKHWYTGQLKCLAQSPRSKGLSDTSPSSLCNHHCILTSIFYFSNMSCLMKNNKTSIFKIKKLRPKKIKDKQAKSYPNLGLWLHSFPSAHVALWGWLCWLLPQNPFPTPWTKYSTSFHRHSFSQTYLYA